MKSRLDSENGVGVKIRRKKPSIDGAFVAAGSVRDDEGCGSKFAGSRLFPRGLGEAKRKAWLRHHSLWFARGSVRVIVPISVGGCFYWCDAVTGSLYTCEGRCLTSRVRIDTSEICAGGDQAVDVLMSLSVGQRGFL